MVNLDFENEKGLLPELDCLEVARKVAERVLENEGFEEDVLISLTITDEEEIHEVNREYRDIDRATDVLSFPALPPEAFTGEVEVTETDFDPETGALYLGDIMICADRVLSQAAEYGHAPLREYAFLVAHSCLHLLGYDHMVPEEEAEMIRRQEEALTSLGIVR